MMGSTVNTMILGGLALAFSRVIDNSVISLENIYRHLEMGAAPMVAAEVGGAEVNLAVLAATLVDVVDFFPGDLSLRREQVSVFRAGAGVLSLAAGLVCSGDDRDSVVLFAVSEGCAPWRGHGTQQRASTKWSRPRRRAIPGGSGSTPGSTGCSTRLLDFYEYWVRRALKRPGLTVAAAERSVCGQPGHLPAAGVGLLSPNRCRAVHHQPEGSHRHAHRSDRTVCGQSGGVDPARRWIPRI